MSKGSWGLFAAGVVLSAGFSTWRVEVAKTEVLERTRNQARINATTPAEAAPPTPVTSTMVPVIAAAVSDSAPSLAAEPVADVQESAEVPTTKTREQRLFELQQHFEADHPADSRAYSIGKEVRTELERALSGTGELRSVDCKLKTCRASLELPGLDADKALFRKILSSNEGVFASYEVRAEREVGPDGSVSTLLFFYL